MTVYEIDDSADPPRRHQRLEVTVGVERQDADPVARTHATLSQGSGESGDSLRDLWGVALAMLADGQGSVRLLLNRPVQKVGQMHGLACSSSRVVLTADSRDADESTPRPRVNRSGIPRLQRGP